MGVNVNRDPAERFDSGHPWRVVARGLLDQVNAAWIGAHPGFTDVVTDNGVGDQTVHLAAAGAATMYGRAIVATTHHLAHAAVLAGVGLVDLQVLGATDAGVAGDVVAFVEVLDTAV
jgi:hypothetical protein